MTNRLSLKIASLLNWRLPKLPKEHRPEHYLWFRIAGHIASITGGHDGIFSELNAVRLRPLFILLQTGGREREREREGGDVLGNHQFCALEL